MDMDEDGVPDLADMCQNTPIEGQPVDEFGCPLDTDGDKVFNYEDDEIASADSAVVNSKGVAQTDEDYFLTYRMYKDSIGEFAVFVDVRDTIITEGGGIGRPVDGIAYKEHVVVVGNEEHPVSANKLHMFLHSAVNST